MPVDLSQEVTPPSSIDQLPDTIKDDVSQETPVAGMRAVQMPDRFMVTLPDSHKMEGNAGDYFLEISPNLSVVMRQADFEEVFGVAARSKKAPAKAETKAELPKAEPPKATLPKAEPPHHPAPPKKT